MRKFFLSLLSAISVALVGCGLLRQAPAAPSVTPEIVTTPPAAAAYANLAALTGVEVPARDLSDLTRRFHGVGDLPVVARTTAPAYAVGDTLTFWIKNHDDEVSEEIEARLIYRSDALNMWLQVGQDVRQRALEEAVRTLETEILPTDRAILGMEWQPGIDGDNRVNILHSTDLGSGVVGYFSAADEFVRAVNPYSNEMEMLYINLRNAPIGSAAYYDVVAHEMAHMIHWHQDQNEAAWVEEGLAVLAAYLNGHNETRYDQAYAEQTDVQLNDFSQFDDMSAAHYGASFLFAAYVLDRLGDEALRAWIGHEENGIAGISPILSAAHIPDFNTLFADWTIATYLQSINRGTGSYAYHNLTVPRLDFAGNHQHFPTHVEGTVHQYAADYIAITNDQPVTLVFTGTQQVRLLNVPAHSGSAYWTSYPADNGDMTLTQAFDLSGLSQATLNFWSWYDIESGWDYAYVVVSRDDGQTWQPLSTIYTTEANPQGNSYGPALTGISGTGSTPTWVEQSADLTPYVGQSILLRFEYVTDQAVHLAGLALDDISISELGFFDDAESDAGGWQAAGFARHSDVLPQSFLLQLILLSDDAVRVQPLALDDRQQGTWTLPLDAQFHHAVLVVSGSTPVTTMPSSYAYELR
ncbi:MAG: immune inhibitor A [Anaerolineales bacterium]|nr:immune inhibitor A [Anaerolineales bacterium]MCB8951321.1 immune inhibitor A [Ardenticatenales bacterium]